MLPGFEADGLEVKGSVFLRDTISTEQVRLFGAKIGGTLDCNGATFSAEEGAPSDPETAFHADGIDVNGQVSLNCVSTEGKIRLVGATLGFGLVCKGATFHAIPDQENGRTVALDASGIQTKGPVVLEELKITGALNFVSAQIGGFSFKQSKHLIGAAQIDLSGIKVYGLLRFIGPQENLIFILAGAWARAFDAETSSSAFPLLIYLNSFEYDGLAGESTDVSADIWLAFLAKQYDPDDPADFYPQPYEQLSAVLRKAGHGEAARAVLIGKERRQRAARRARTYAPQRQVLAAWDGMLGATVRYGRQPLWAFVWLLGFWIYGVAVFTDAERAGVLKPNKEVVLRSDEWVGCAGDPRGQAACYLATERGASYPRFNVLAYSADTLLPIVSLEMQEYWIPDDRAGPGGWWARVYLWVHIAVGWALSLLAVAGFSGLVKSD